MDRVAPLRPKGWSVLLLGHGLRAVPTAPSDGTDAERWGLPPGETTCFDVPVPYFLDELLWSALAVGITLVTLYWVIRLAVEHALREHRRAQ